MQNEGPVKKLNAGHIQDIARLYRRYRKHRENFTPKNIN